MKKGLLMLMMILVFVLAACSKNAEEFETVQDTVVPVSSQKTMYTISVHLPDDMVEETFSEGEDAHFYEQADGAYDVCTQILTDVSVEDALRDLTGQDSQTLTVLKTDRCGLPEYRTSWYTMSEEGGRVHRASVLYDGTVCYCVSFSMPEENTQDWTKSMQTILDSISLNPIES